jgi:hypothetical protein
MSVQRLLLRTLVTAALSCALGASAAVVSFTGTCTGLCAGIGLANNASVSATFNVSSGLSLNNLTLGKASVQSFVVDIGTVDFTNNDLSNWDFVVSTNAAGLVTSFQFLASFGLPQNPGFTLGDTVDLRLSNWFAVDGTGVCSQNPFNPVLCDFQLTTIFASSTAPAVGPATVSLTASNVPEPSSWVLAAAALLALARRPGQGRLRLLRQA